MWDSSAASRISVPEVMSLAIKVFAPLLVVATALWAITTRFGASVRSVGPSCNDFVPLIRRTGDRNFYPSSTSAASSGSSAAGILQIFVRQKNQN
jgi:hypothetical protein